MKSKTKSKTEIKIRPILRDILKDIDFDSLPYEWTSFDLENFSKNKKLWNFQKEALQNAIKILCKYYEKFGENLTPEERKKKLYELYKYNGLDIDLDIKLSRINGDIAKLLKEYYKEENGKIPYWNFINRASFWMATGSGKTLIIVKLIQILIELMKRKKIPKGDILFLTHRDDLIEQFKRHLDEANINLKLYELKEYNDVKRQPSFLTSVFYYRADNIDDEQKEKRIDFRNYDNGGNWYIILDEAHKGDKEDSKRQHIYSILSRNGFLFNFSATFTDERDIITCAYEFNLSSFIEECYGKHILILGQEVKAFRDKEDYSNEEKQKIILKSFILLTYIKKFYERIKDKKLYHNPLLLVLVNSVNEEDSDLKKFFEEVKNLGKGNINSKLLEEAKKELWEEFKNKPKFVFEDNYFSIDKNHLESITLKEILKYVYNSESYGDIEISYRPSDKSQVAFKLTTSDRPFALIRTGGMPKWLKDELNKYQVNHQFEEEGYFERINDYDSPINVLIGSRAFYEGWDSNRPNLIMFINIGVGKDAKKFVLQSIGRGVRLEPIPNKRKRAICLYNNGEIDQELYDEIKDLTLPIETLFIFGTKKNVITTIIEELKTEQKEECQKISLDINEQVKGLRLLIPVYKTSNKLLLDNKNLAKFEVSEEELKLLKEYFEDVPDKIILINYNTTPKAIKKAREILNSPEDYFKTDGRSIKNLDLLVERFINYIKLETKELERFKDLEDEITHYTKIMVCLEDISDLKGKIEKVKNYPQKRKELSELYGKISHEEFMEQVKELKDKEDFEFDNKKIQIRYVANHYYIPLILSLDEKIEFIKHIIKTKSEVEFINDLEKYLSKDNNKFKEFDQWAFSKIDEHLDNVYIPYYHPEKNSILRFKPDFIFWLKKGNKYYIVFIDPKSYKHTEYEYKVDGYKALFEEEGQKKVFKFEDLEVKVYLFLRTEDRNKIPEGYRSYWFDDIEKVLESLT